MDYENTFGLYEERCFMNISIIIINYNTQNLLLNCIKSIYLRRLHNGDSKNAL